MTHELVLIAVVLLAAAVIAVPLAKRAGLGSIIGYLVAGIVVGPAGLDLVPHADSMMHVAELGVVTGPTHEIRQAQSGMLTG